MLPLFFIALYGYDSNKEVCMLAEFSIIPIGVGSSVGDQLADTDSRLSKTPHKLLFVFPGL